MLAKYETPDKPFHLLIALYPDAAKAKDFKAVWDEFRKTRDNEIIPHIYAGKKAEAKALATGVQAERMKKLKGVMGCQ